MILLRLYWEFFLIGLFSVGGGMATVPFLFDLSARTGWFSAADLANMIAISEATPGPIGVNMATYAGSAAAGVPGGIIAPLGLVTPAFLAILLVARVLMTVWKSPRIQGLFHALRPASVGLIAAACWTVCTVSLFSLKDGLDIHLPSLILFAVILAGMNLPKVKDRIPAVAFVGLAALAGIVFRMVD